MKKALAKLSTGAALTYLSVSNAFAQSENTNSPAAAVGEAGTTYGSKVGTLKVVKASNVGVDSIGRLISAAFSVAVLIAVIFVFMQLIQGGYSWISAGGDKSKVEEARNKITNALIGLAIVAAAWALIIVIGKFFGVNVTELNLPSATGDNAGYTGGGL